MRIRLVVPGNVRHNSGGNVYNAALARELAALGVEVQTCMLDGGWPVGSAEDRQRLAAALCDDGGAAAGTDGAAAGSTVTVVDGLLACGAPEALAAARAAGLPAWILLHMPLDDTGHGEAELERQSLQAAAGVICTSTSAAARTRARHGLDGILVALPGTDRAPLSAGALSEGSGPPHLVAVAALLPNKDQALLLAALQALADLPWTASLIGADTADPAYAAHLRGTVQRLGLQDRIRIPGELRGAALAAEWDAAGLSLLISRAETYGLVVTESIARGVPVVVRAGTGAVEALAAGAPAVAEGAGSPLPGTAVALDADPAPLAQVLRRWLSDPGVRSGWRAAALEARGRLPGWDATARAVLAALDPHHPAVQPLATPEEKGAAGDSPAAPAGGQ
ncbi:glycosyltransferase [Arthrobacter sp. EPSL27]|uniref:glycosyltransferase n=1 Tax=Arthrobacter sp. EPSL27 TaxID=1745378 RepID=UPI0009E9675B|nr:glycosyltransferase [Arthrobacter sp. EPSL27]